MRYVFVLIAILAVTGFSQDSGIKLVTSGQLVEIAPASSPPDTSGIIITIKTPTGVLKTVVLDDWFAPELLGSIRYDNNEYFLMRTSNGSGQCGPGTIHVFEFRSSEDGSGLAGVSVSPALPACGLSNDFVPFSFRERAEGKLVLDVQGVYFSQSAKGKLVKNIDIYSLDLSTMDRWVDKKTGKLIR